MRAVLSTLTSIPLFVANTLYLMALVVLGTLAQKGLTNPDAVVHSHFGTLFLNLALFLYIPGVPLSLGLMALSLALKLSQKPLTLQGLPTFLSHLGVILLIASALVLTATQKSGYLLATTGQPTTLWQAQPQSSTAPPSAWPVIGNLPFPVTLHTFTHTTHPGTSIPASYSSLLTFGSGPQALTRTVSMNAPVRIQGYTFYQASFIDDPNQPVTSILTVNHNPFRLLPYLATALLALGLLTRLLQRLPKAWWKALVLILALTPAVHAQSLATLPIQHEGRTKSLLTAAHILMPNITGQSMSPAHALSDFKQLIFTPTAYTTAPHFVVNTTLQKALELPTTPQGAYPLPALLTAFQAHGLPALMNPTTVPALRQQLQMLADRLADTLQIARTFTLWRPMLNVQNPLAEALSLRRGTYSAAQILTRRTTMLKLAKVLPTQSPLLQQQLLTLTEQLKAIEPETPNTLLTLIPPAHGGNTWLSPWEFTRQSTPPTPAQKPYVDAWQALLTAKPAPLPKPSWNIALDAFLTRTPPVTFSLIPLALTLLVLPFGRLRKAAYPLALTGFTLLTFALTARCLLLGRPPVATLYESTLFVAEVLLFMGLVLHRPRQPYLAVTAGLALILAAISHFLTLGADSMGMLTAVLNTRFWLAVHVLTITGGYALSLLTGAVGTFSLWQKKPHPGLPALLVASLLLTGIGTLLGGVWADQSWGRFWGWDPKENGALILTLYLAILAHLPLWPTAQRAYLPATSLTPAVVALSWFGVNLLGAGLHSYGFTSGLTSALATFCGLNILLTLLLSRRHA